MATSCDVAALILNELGPMTSMKLQKLVYYSQAWHLVWDEERLFDDRIEAWANGPVCPKLYAQHRGMFVVEPGSISGDPNALTASQRESVQAVCDSHGDISAADLSRMTHMEPPWREARGDLPAGASSQAEITLDSLQWYESLLPC